MTGRCAVCAKPYSPVALLASVVGEVCATCYGQLNPPSPGDHGGGPTMCPVGEHHFDPCSDICRKCKHHGMVVRLQQGRQQRTQQPQTALERRGYDELRIENARDQFAEYVTRETVPLAIHEPLRAELDAARKRIAELERDFKELEANYDEQRELRRADRARDEERETLYGTVRNERDDLLRENAVLRRKLEAAERKGGKR